MRRPARLLFIAAALAALALEFAPFCATGGWTRRAPDGRGDTLTACRGFMPFAMPGQGGDAPGWLVLRDEAGFVRNATSLEMASTVGDMEPSWTPDRVTVPLHADMGRPGPLPLPLAFVTDRLWRLRSLLGLTPRDTSHR